MHLTPALPMNPKSLNRRKRTKDRQRNEVPTSRVGDRRSNRGVQGFNAHIFWGILSPSLADSRRGEGETLPASRHNQSMVFTDCSTGEHFRRTLTLPCPRFAPTQTTSLP